MRQHKKAAIEKIINPAPRPNVTGRILDGYYTESYIKDIKEVVKQLNKQ